MSEKKQTNLRVFKLRSGEEIVAELIGKVTGKVIVSRPMKINNSIVADPFTGVRKKIMYLNDWLGNSNEIQITLPNNFIVLDLSPDPSIISLYNKQLDLDDVASSAPPPTVANPPDIFPELTEKDMKDLSDSVIKQYDKLKDEARTEIKKIHARYPMLTLLRNGYYDDPAVVEYIQFVDQHKGLN